MNKQKIAIDQLLAELRGGLTKKLWSEMKKRNIARRETDRKKLKQFPPIQVQQEAVRKGMFMLQWIATKHKDDVELTGAIQSEANAAMCGICALNGYFGRKMEWEILTAEHIQNQINDDLDFIVCTEHKTSSTYGSLAKWLAAGTISAAACYLGLPRRPDVKTFFSPISKSTDRMDVPAALRRFCIRYLPEEYVFPTVNLLRKWYHTKLSELATNQDKFLEMVKTIDPHSKGVAQRHYILQSPEDDARMAMHLVKAMIGEPVQWPPSGSLEDTDRLLGALVQHIPEHTDQPDAINAEDDDDDNEQDLDWFENAGQFGINKPMDVLADQPDNGHGVLLDKNADLFSNVDDNDARGAKKKEKKHMNKKRDKSFGGDADDVKECGSPDAKKRHKAALPMFVIFGSENSGEQWGSDAALEKRAAEACRVVAGQPQYKTRYYMSPPEKQWLREAIAEFTRVTGSNKADTAFCTRLYKWGVFEQHLDRMCSPGGLRSFMYRVADSGEVSDDTGAGSSQGSLNE